MQVRVCFWVWFVVRRQCWRATSYPPEPRDSKNSKIRLLIRPSSPCSQAFTQLRIKAFSRPRCRALITGAFYTGITSRDIAHYPEAAMEKYAPPGELDVLSVCPPKTGLMEEKLRMNPKKLEPVYQFENHLAGYDTPGLEAHSALCPRIQPTYGAVLEDGSFFVSDGRRKRSRNEIRSRRDIPVRLGDAGRRTSPSLPPNGFVLNGKRPGETPQVFIASRRPLIFPSRLFLWQSAFDTSR